MWDSFYRATHHILEKAVHIGVLNAHAFHLIDRKNPHNGFAELVRANAKGFQSVRSSPSVQDSLSINF